MGYSVYDNKKDKILTRLVCVTNVFEWVLVCRFFRLGSNFRSVVPSLERSDQFKINLFII